MAASRWFAEFPHTRTLVTAHETSGKPALPNYVRHRTLALSLLTSLAARFLALRFLCQLTIELAEASNGRALRLGIVVPASASGGRLQSDTRTYHRRGHGFVRPPVGNFQ